MAEHDQDNDEYTFEGLDSLDNEPIENPDDNLGEESSKSQVRSTQGTNVKRNALIVIGLVVFSMLMYKFVGGMLSKKATVAAVQNEIPPMSQESVLSTPSTPKSVENTQIPSQPIPQSQTAPESNPTQENISELQQKVASIEASQLNVQSEVSSLNQEITNVNSNLTALNNQITKLGQTLNDLSSQVVKQSEEINVLMERIKPKIIKRQIIRSIPKNLQIIYHLNAVIPGRAWLIGTNGSTLTVREGTSIPGYGTVKLIDSLEGRVLTSSGRIIKFSQEDS